MITTGAGQDADVEASATPHADVLRVLDAGALTTVQDGGRPGWAHLGVPRAGAVDQPAAGLANRLVGNPGDAAVLETTLTGVTLKVTRERWVAVTGAGCMIRLDGRAVAHGEPIRLAAGSVLQVGPALAGVRSYVAFAGGVDVPRVLGSRSTDTLAGVGPGLLRDGDVLPLGQPVGVPRFTDVAAVNQSAPRVVVLRWWPGPRADWLAGGLAQLDGATFTVGEASNRVGLRLHGTALERRPGELVSEGVVLGAVQVPPDGQPVVFLADHPVTGGYPVVAVLHADDLALCAQLRVGDAVRFTPARR